MARQSEIHHLKVRQPQIPLNANRRQHVQITVVGDQNVGGLEVSMNNRLGTVMNIGHDLHEFQNHGGGMIWLERRKLFFFPGLPTKHLSQIPAVHEFILQTWNPRVRQMLIFQLDDAWMIQLISLLHFILERLDPVLIRFQTELEHGGTKSRMLGSPDRSEMSTPQELRQFI